jgi:capsular polysaccharide biosynthesis protein
MQGMEHQLCIDMYGDLPYGVFILKDATLRGDAAYIFTRDGAPLVEQNADFLRKGKFLRPHFSEEHLTIRATREFDDLISLTSRCDSGFFHWMMDSLPKVVIAEGCGFTGSYLIPATAAAPWAEESLSILGISPNRIITHTSSDIHARRLYIPTYFSGYNAHHNAAFMMIYRDAIRHALQLDPHPARERILIARKPATKVRRIINQEEVIQTAAAFGFQHLYFEDLSLREQLQRALAAEAMIGAHGSGLCHSLFMDQRSTLIELFPYGRKQSCDVYEKLATIPQHQYHAIESSEDREGDIVVSPGVLGVLLERAFR